MTRPWVWIVVGFASAHVFWTVAFGAWWFWLTRGDRAKLAKAQRDFTAARRAIRENRPYTW